ncbi:MAG: hypothetical protein JSW23_07320 [Planctomycetota bacterium]|nr:MAG: hypothetical protein JSW23_07320 [Planctomycetota bacterium]
MKGAVQPGRDGYCEGVFSAGVVDEEDCAGAGDDVLSGEEDGEEDRGDGEWTDVRSWS